MTGLLRWAMVVLGIIFVINSLDSLIRLYTDNLGFNIKRLGLTQYVSGNFLLIGSLVLLYQLTPLKIEWVGLIVIGLYMAIYILIFKNRTKIRDSFILAKDSPEI